MTHVFAAWRNEFIAFGGIFPRSSDMSNETHALNMASMYWRKLEFRATLSEPRINYTAALCGSKMYVFGGHGSDGYMPDITSLWDTV